MFTYESVYEELRSGYQSASPEQRLSILKHELLRPIHTVEAVAAVLDLIDVDALAGLPENLTPEAFDCWRGRLAGSVKEMKEILDALTLD